MRFPRAYFWQARMPELLWQAGMPELLWQARMPALLWRARMLGLLAVQLGNSLAESFRTVYSRPALIFKVCQFWVLV